MTEDLLSNTGEGWTGVSASLVPGRRLVAAIWCGFFFLLGLFAVGAVWFGTRSALWTLPAVLFVVLVAGLFWWIWSWAARNQASWAYLETENELMVRGGIMFRRIVVVPYGRMQFVDVDAGPIATKFGYASVTLHTAASETAATIPGVPLAEAHRLRNELTELGDPHEAGI